MSGKKESEGKPPMELVAPEAVVAMADVCAFGRGKYGERNWEKGIRLTRLFAAAQRHMWEWLLGRDINEESGLSHLDHALWNLMAMVAFTRRGAKHLDDRLRLDPETGVTIAEGVDG